MRVNTTPWGKPDHTKTYAEGIICYDCPGHGGFRLSAARCKELHKVFPGYGTTWFTFVGSTGGGFSTREDWFEEDRDAAVVVAAFPELFDPKVVANCKAAIEKDSYYAGLREPVTA